MRRFYGAFVTLAAAALASAAVAAPSVKIDHAVARVVVSPENRADIKIEVVGANPKLPLRTWTFMGRTYVDGGIHTLRIRSCGGTASHPNADVLGLGHFSEDQLPTIIIHSPPDVHVLASGAVFGRVIRSESVELDNAGCGEWDVGNVHGRLKVAVTGSGSVHAGQAAAAELMVAGSGDISTREITGAVGAENVGSGDIEVASASGALSTRIAGSGHVRVAGGHVTAMQVSIAGSGDVVMRGQADSLRASLVGSGDVQVAKVNGAVSKAVVGSGEVRVGS
jgi:putative autotransporter adhesin-like protein